MSPRFVVPFIVLVTLAVRPTYARPGSGEKPTTNGIAFFESKIRPVLVAHCYRCHSVKSGRARGGLRVDSRKAIRTGGDRVPAVIPGNAKGSWLLKAVLHSEDGLKMPPRKKRLSAAIIGDLRNWIELGAPDPREEKADKLASAKVPV